MYAITGATGQLGRLVVDHLLATVPADRIVAAVRDPAKAGDLAARGVQVRQADYDRPESLGAALQGVERLLLISSNVVGQRVPQHLAVIEAATKAGVGLLAYTSVLHADRSPLGLAEEHRQTEAAIRQSGLPFTFLRNGWYTENYLMSLPAVLEHGALIGSAGQGRIAGATRTDYAQAAARVLAGDDPAGRTHELAGDEAWTLAELAAEISRQAGKNVVYQDLPQAEYEKMLLGFGLPAPMADLIADSDARAAEGALDDQGGELGKLLGRPTTPLAKAVAEAMAKLHG